MAEFPYLLYLEQVLTAGGVGTPSYTVPANEKLEISQLFVASTGTFEITDLRDSAGKHYTNASLSTGIQSGLLARAANNYNVFIDFPVPIILEGALIIYVDLFDTSGAGNTIGLLLPGKRITPGS
jgi:hypothetical protein